MTEHVRVAVLASGAGSNLQALIEADLGPAALRVVICNVPGARALERAESAGIESLLIDHKAFGSRAQFDAEVVAALKARAVDWVVLAGFLRIVGEPFVEAFPNRIVNVHPALLPAFPGLKAQRQALEAGARIAGCTVHLVDAGVDSGPILAQAAVPVLADDDEARLSRRILQQEHKLLPAVVRALAEGRLVEDGPRRFHLAVDPIAHGALVSPAGVL